MSDGISVDNIKISARGPDELAAMVVSAYVANNSVPVKELADLYSTVRDAIAGVAQPQSETIVEKPSQKEIKRSITPGGLTSFIDGKSYKTLKRHLTKHNLTPDSYRRKFGLPDDYPMVSQGYSQRRSELAKAIGLGYTGAKAA